MHTYYRNTVAVQLCNYPCIVQTTSTTATAVPVIHSSPKVAEYIRSLPRRSPRKSPLSKYLRLRNRSPLKPTLHRQATKRVKLDFSVVDGRKLSELQQKLPSTVSTSEQAVTSPAVNGRLLAMALPDTAQQQSLTTRPVIITNQLSSHSPLSANQTSARLNLSPSITNLSTSSPTLMSIMQVHSSKTPEVVQLSRGESPAKQRKFRVVTVPKDSLEGCGSFGSLALANLFSAANESYCPKEKAGESISEGARTASSEQTVVSQSEAGSPVVQASKKQADKAAAPKSQPPSEFDSDLLTTLTPISSPVASSLPVTASTSPTSAAPSETPFRDTSCYADKSKPTAQVSTSGRSSLHSLLSSAVTTSQSPIEPTAKSSGAGLVRIIPLAGTSVLPQLRVVPHVNATRPQHPPVTVSQNVKPV